VDVLAVEHLGDDPTLGREPPVPVPQAHQEITDVHDVTWPAIALGFPSW
jgi:hypothetical protein